MIFDLNGSKYMVKFFRSTNKVTKEFKPTTFAKLYKFVNELNTWMEINLTAALCNPKDNYSKSKGRKLALHRLLSETQELDLSKENRTRIWEIYFKEHRK